MIVYDRAFSGEVAAKLGDALQDLASGLNEEFAADYLAAVRKGTPDFTSGNRIAWLQYESGTVVEGEGDLLKPSLSGPCPTPPGDQ